MNYRPIPADQYYQQLRALGAWWRMGSSALAPQLLVQLLVDESTTPRTAYVAVTDRES